MLLHEVLEQAETVLLRGERLGLIVIKHTEQVVALEQLRDTIVLLEIISTTVDLHQEAAATEVVRRSIEVQGLRHLGLQVIEVLEAELEILERTEVHEVRNHTEVLRLDLAATGHQVEVQAQEVLAATEVRVVVLEVQVVLEARAVLQDPLQVEDLQVDHLAVEDNNQTIIRT